MLTFKYRKNKAHSEEHATRNLILATAILPIVFILGWYAVTYYVRTGNLPPVPNIGHVIGQLLQSGQSCNSKEAIAIWAEANTAIAQDIYGYTYVKQGKHWERTGKNVSPSHTASVTIDQKTYKVSHGKIETDGIEADLCG